MKKETTILVVDDELMMRQLLERILARDGYRVFCAAGGEEALAIMAREQISIVISDLQMTGMSGFELLKAIKKDFPQASIIMMTAFGDTYTVKDALLLGADEYITKPFKSFEISMVVERAYWRQLSQSVSQTAQTD